MSQLWNLLHAFFDTDDGALPDIEINNLKTREVEEIYVYLRRNSELVSRDSYFWSMKTQEAIPLDAVQNAARLLVNGEAECFHFVIGGLTFGEKIIPDLGVFVFKDSITLDYRMGAAWGSAELEALFACFDKIRELAPLVEIEVPNPPAARELFKSVLLKYWNQEIL